jgi:hypothetical protein
MANFGRRPVTDAGKPKPAITYYFDGEQRIDRRPLGKVERFVDPQGAVVSLALASDGDPQKAMTIDKMRFQYRRDGFVEHAKCPLRHGTHLSAGKIAKDFAAMPAKLSEPCAVDPKTLKKVGHDLHATESCPHIEWLIASRVLKEKQQNDKRNASRMAAEKRELEKRELESIQLEMAKEQIEEHKAKRGAKKAAALPGTDK